MNCKNCGSEVFPREFALARAEFEQMLALYDPDQHQASPQFAVAGTRKRDTP